MPLGLKKKKKPALTFSFKPVVVYPVGYKVTLYCKRENKCVAD